MMSIITGPHQAHIIFPRIQLALALFPQFTIEEHDALSHQIVSAWTLSPKKLVTVIAQNRDNIDNIRILLLDHHPQILNDITTALEKTH